MVRLSLLFVVLSMTLVASAFGDGGIVIYDPYMSMGWKLKGMDQQLCAITYESGIERMLLTVDVHDLRGEKAVWIFPTPARPDDIRLNIVKGFPRLMGFDLRSVLNEKLFDVFWLMRLTQVYTVFFMPYMIANDKMEEMTRAERDVRVHEHIESMGLTTELVTARDGHALYAYLEDRKLDLPRNFITILGEYIGQEYSFVVSWISDIEKYKKESAKELERTDVINNMGVFISFPTDEIFFPLRPTSVYGSESIPVLIYVMGHVTPRIYPEIERGSNVDYFDLESVYVVPKELSGFFNGHQRIEDLKYTRIEIFTSCENLTADLWMNDSAPLGVMIAELIHKSLWIWALLIFLVDSCLASLLAGTIAFRKHRVTSKGKLALFGLWNLTTLIGFGVATIFLKTKEIDAELSKELRSRRFKIVVWDIRKVLFTLLFTFLFLIISALFQVILHLLTMA